jgi:alpha-1,3-rhamnosyl/mannosyltransferase
VVCSDAGSLPEVAGEAALLVAPGDAQGFARAIGTLLTDDALRRVQIARGLAHCQQFTWERAAQQTAAVYERVTEGHGIR